MKQNNFKKNGFSRREFIKLSGMTSIATLISPGIFDFGNQSNKTAESVSFQEHYLPIISKCDVLVIGGGFAGVSAARDFAKSGKSVVLMERRIYLGREITSTYRPWVNHPGASRSELPGLLTSCIEPEIEQPFADQTLFRFNKVKLTLEEELLGLGVEIIYASFLLQLIADGNKLQGLVIGNKSGRQVILSKMILDCTENASLARLTDVGFQKPLSQLSTFTRALEYIQIKPLTYKYLDVPENLKIKNNRVYVQQGYIGNEHYYIDCAMEFPEPQFDVTNTVAREKEAWKRSIAVSKYLFDYVPEFNDAFLATSSFSLNGIYSSQMQELPSEKRKKIPSSIVEIINSSQVNIESFATTFENLWCINEAARLTPELTNYLLTPQGACLTAVPVCKYLLNNWDKLAINKLPETSAKPASKAKNEKTSIKEQESPQKGRLYEYFNVDIQSIPVLENVDILIVGGGTSGATAAIAAAEGGKTTLVVDMNPGFGGTGTFGGVLDYWGHGNYKGFVARHIREVDEIHKFIPNYSKRYEDWIKPFVTWNVQAKKFMLLMQIENAGAKIVWNSLAIGTIMDGKKVTGVVIATPQGIYAVHAKVTIDATGDGDVASFAGAPFVFGSASDNVPMWTALCKTKIPGITETSFQNTADVSNIHDYTRSVMVGLRSGSNLHDHYTYLAPRESRHILGDVVVTLTDHMKMKEWDDVINIHYSNCDIKGYHSSDWLRMGLISPNYEIEIPYRAIIPKTIDNIIVVGKAFSVNHESLATVRMMPDLENLGGIAGLAAVFALNSGVNFRKLDVKAFQKQLVGLDLLPSSILNREIEEKKYTGAEIEEMIQKFDPEKSLHSYSDMEMGEIWTEKIPLVEVCTSPPEIAVPALEKALNASSGKMAVRIAQALAFFGAESAAKTLHDEILVQLASNKLPELLESVKWSDSKKMPPDQAAMPQCANLIYSLGMTRSELNIPVWERVAELFEPKQIEDFYTNRLGLFYYVDAISYSAQLMGTKMAIGPLKKLHGCEFLNNRTMKKGIELNYAMERIALLELIIGRALARSGSVDGLKILIEYLDDVRAVLAEFANTTLFNIADTDLGKSKTEWYNWLSLNESSYTPVPLIERVDG